MNIYSLSTKKSAFHSDKAYDVYLSFRGSDVRKTLVDHLYTALSAAGLNVCLGSEILEKGEMIGLSLERAIANSSIRVPIFSEGYADSVWCLREAAAMLMTPGSIVPLFYHVDPIHVRYPLKKSSPYNQSFQKHYGHLDRYSREAVEGWDHALQQISCISGWVTDKVQGGEGRLVEMVVKELIQMLHRVPTEVAKHDDLKQRWLQGVPLEVARHDDLKQRLQGVPLEVAKYPVGLSRLTEDLIQKLNLNSMDDVVKIGIWGFGGIGKTTVAKALYNQIYANFDAASFVSNVCTTASEPTGLTRLQKQILEELTQYNGVVGSVDMGINLFRDRLEEKHVLLILDDVDDVEQLYALVGDWLDSGSRVIITSRDKHILNIAHVSFKCIHEMRGLEIREGLELFSWHAFVQKVPILRYEDLSKEIVEACNGHPLSLEVIGSFLYDKEDEPRSWKAALHEIIQYPDIHQRLIISYNALSEDEKEIFVDIACFFTREHNKFPIVFWKSLYSTVDAAVLNLLMKSLIKIDNDVFDMHDHLQNMGQEIAEKDNKCTRLREAAHLSTHSNIYLSRLRLNKGNLQSLDMLYRPGLRYLHLQNLHIEGMTEDTLYMLPPSLVWLRLEQCSFATGTDRTVNKPHDLIVEKVWQLKIMQLKGCSNLDSLFISSLFSLPNIQLQHLDLGGCTDLKNLPDTIGNLSELEYLYLGGCSNLNHLPDTFRNLSKLQHLGLERCIRLKNLPYTIGSLSELKHLDLGWCGSLKSLPETIGNLSQLQHFTLRGCERLNSPTDTICKLAQLQHLNMFECLSLTNLPDDIGHLSQLQHLDLRSNDKLKELPESIGDLSQLRDLYLGGCRSLNNLPDTIGNLSQLQQLDLEGCISLNILPDTIGNLSQLQHLDLGWCESLKKLPETIGNLLQLQYLKLRGCEKLKNLPSTMANLSHVEFCF